MVYTKGHNEIVENLYIESFIEVALYDIMPFNKGDLYYSYHCAEKGHTNLNFNITTKYLF